MSRRVQENIAILILLAFFVGVVVISLDFGPRARLVPVPIAIFAILLLIFQLFWQNVRSADELNVDLLDVLTDRGQTPDAARDNNVSDTTTAVDEAQTESAQWRRIAIGFGFVAVFVVMIMLIGPIPSIFIFTTAYFILSGHFSPAKAIGYTTVFTAAVYSIFVEALRLQLYHGYLEPVAEFLRRL